MALDLATNQSRMLVKGATKTIIVGHKTPALYFSKTTADPYFFRALVGECRNRRRQKLADLRVAQAL